MDTYKFYLTPQTMKPSFCNNHTQTWVAVRLHLHLVRMPPSLGPEASSPGTTRQGDEIREPATLTRDHIWDQSLTAQQYIIPKRRYGQVTKGPGQVTKVPGQTPHITTE